MYRGARRAVTMNAGGIASARSAELRRRERDQLVELRAEVGERVAERAAELLREGDVPEAVPRRRAAVDDRRVRAGTRPPRSGSSRYTSATRPEGRAEAGKHESPAPPDARLDREHVQRDRRDEQERQRVVARREAEDDRPRATSRRSARRGRVDVRGSCPAPRRPPSGRARAAGSRRTRGGAGADRRGSR